ncbi:hypothetical protein N656DRAFT_390402 [Canariomyces notabilis]|uniref:Uncharacterized protein n=1 Tax=Canariomyces notabilis TaxID=2074819 RepID=A0AAN6TJJ0_9PEZI|nr:hypothetical protein N656DRAFT_390402 [Canariomyces arenarius]
MGAWLVTLVGLIVSGYWLSECSAWMMIVLLSTNVSKGVSIYLSFCTSRARAGGPSRLFRGRINLYGRGLHWT